MGDEHEPHATDCAGARDGRAIGLAPTSDLAILTYGRADPVSDDLFSPREQRRGAVLYLQAVRAHWLLILLMVVVATVAAYAFVTTAEERYEASADLVLSPLPGGDDTFQGFSLFRQSFDGSSSVVTAARVFNSAQTRAVADDALDELGIDAVLSAEPVTQADIVSMGASAPSAGAAAQAANTFAESAVATRTALFQRELLDHIGRLQRRVAAIPAAQRATNPEYASLAGRLGELRGFIGSPDPTVRVAAQATPPTSAAWPRPRLTIGAAFIAALMLGIGLAVLLEVVNPRVSREDDLVADQRLPILARIPRFSQAVARGYLAGRRSQLPGAAWKGYRTLRASLATAGPEGSFPRSILITSASPSDGKTMTAVNLAITLASADMRVILVDADLQRPMVATNFNAVAPRGGFGAVLSGQKSVKASVIETPARPNLRLLLARPEGVAAMRLFDPIRIGRAVEALTAEADVVIFDAPPVTEVAETLELAAAVDTVVLAVRLGHTRRDRLDDLRSLLLRRGVAPVGFVVTTSESSDTDSPYGYQGEVSETVADEPPVAPGRQARWVASSGDR